VIQQIYEYDLSTFLLKENRVRLLCIQTVRCHGDRAWPIFNPKQNFKDGSNFVNSCINIYLLLFKLQNYTERSQEIAYRTPIYIFKYKE